MLASIFGNDAVTESGLAQAANEQEFGKDAKNLVMKMAKEQRRKALGERNCDLEKGSAAGEPTAWRCGRYPRPEQGAPRLGGCAR